MSKTVSIIALAWALGVSASHASTPDVMAPVSKRPISYADYANWRSIQGAVLSRDGRWAAYALVAQENDGDLVVRRLADGREWRTPRGTAPAFSADGRYLAFAVQPTQAEIDKAKKDKKGDDLPKPGGGWMDLETGKVETVERVKRFAWGLEGGTQLALLLEAPRDPKAKKDSGDAATKKGKEPGTELMLVDASQSTRRSFKDVAEFAWSRQGDLLAYSVSVKEPAKPAAAASSASAVAGEAKPADTAREGVYLVDVSGSKVLLNGAGSYKQLQFDHAGRMLAFVNNRDAIAEQGAKPVDKDAEDKDSGSSKPKDPTPFKLYLWRADAGAAAASAQELVSTQTPGMPAGWAPSEFAALKFSKDGQRLFLGTALTPKAEPKDAPEPMKVDLWHWKDAELQSQQKVNAEKDRQRSYRALVQLAQDKPRFLQLANEDMPSLEANENARFALGTNDKPYRMLASWDSDYFDAYAVDLQTGERRLLASKLRSKPTLSPAGRYVLAFDRAQKAWRAWRTADGHAFNLSGKIAAHFENLERDVPEPAPAFGTAGWTADDQAVVLYDQFDLWSVEPESQQARNLTAGFGRKHRLELRYVPLDTEDAEAKPLPADGLMLAASHEVDRSTGYYRVASGGGEPVALIRGDELIGGLIKAKQADAVLFTKQSFIEFPDLWSSRLDLQSPQRISRANPQQSQFNWGTQEQIEYTSADGKKLRALLAKPENFDPKKKYPMMVYIYEKMTDKLHNYVPPAPAQNINVTSYVSRGYVVLRPDIEYTIGYPGRSALRTVVPAVQQAIKLGFVDPKRVGIQGHSWGAYQINYLITHTDIFRAAEAGAAMADMISGYGGIRWGPGISRAFQYEQQQSRMGGTPWGMPGKYIENSAIFRVDKVHTPYLTIHNDEDDAVPYYQAIEFFTALRRLGKEAYWFNFNGAKHGLRDREQMKYYTLHMSEFFDHYLLDAPRPEWMDKPVPYLERGKRDIAPIYKPAASAAP